MDTQSQNTSSTSNQGLDEKFRNRHKTDYDRTDDGQVESAEFKATKDKEDVVRGFADKANDIGGLNEDKSTISDTSAPSASMQDEEKK